MHTCFRGLIAGAAATTVLALLLLLHGASGVMAQLDLVQVLARVLGESRGSAWLVVWVVGVAGYGLVLAALSDPDRSPLPLALGLAGAGWFAVMMGVLPMGGYAPFGIGLGVAVPLLTAAWSLAFGATLGWSYALLPALAQRIGALASPRPGGRTVAP